MTSRLPLNPALAGRAGYQPARPIEEVARELGCRPMTSSNSPRTRTRSDRRPPRSRRCKGPRPPAPLSRCNAFYLSKRLAQKLGLEPGNLILGNGSNEIIEFVGHALMSPGADVYRFAILFRDLPDCRPAVRRQRDHGPRARLWPRSSAMLAAITPRTRVVFVANPNNPTGTLAPSADVLRLVKETPERVLLVMDEAYIEFSEKPTDLLPMVRRGEKPNLLLMRDVLKNFRTGRTAPGLWHGASGFDRRPGKSAAAVQH